MENQHRKIKGYRELSAEEIDLMNRIKAKGDELLDLQKELNARLATESIVKCKAAAASTTHQPFEQGASDECIEWRRFKNAEPMYWAEIGKKDIQTAIMALVRAVAQPAI